MSQIGGQAVIEGVMMKSPTAWTVAVRDQKGVIHLKREQLRSLPKALKLPILRGVVTLFHTLVLGIMALEYSAGKAYEGEAEEKPLSKAAIAGTIAFALVLGVGLFILLPLYATKLVGIAIKSVSASSVLFNLVDGAARVAIFVLYIVIIGMWGEIQRVFQYHGAEHKAIYAHEKGLPLTVENVMPQSVLHPRCGTSFLLIVMVVSILVFSTIPQSWPFLWKFLSRIVLLPVIAGLSYETLKLSAKFEKNPVVHAMILPGLWLQRLTTAEPDEGQVEVAIKSLEEVLKDA